jgi:hypothetical protein
MDSFDKQKVVNCTFSCKSLALWTNRKRGKAHSQSSKDFKLGQMQKLSVLKGRLTRLDLPGSVLWFNKPWRHVTLDLQYKNKIFTLTLIFNGSLKFLCDPN